MAVVPTRFKILLADKILIDFFLLNIKNVLQAADSKPKVSKIFLKIYK